MDRGLAGSPGGRQSGPAIVLGYGTGGSRLGDRLFVALRAGDTTGVVQLPGVPSGAFSAQAARDAVAESDALVAVVDDAWRRWTAGQTPDALRLGLEAAVADGVPIVPVLPEGERMPTAAELPPSLEQLTRLNPLEIHEDTWDLDVARLARAVRAA